MTKKTPPPAALPAAHFGKLIVVEGIDGAGKSTLIESLAKKLARHGHRVKLSVWRDSPTVGPYLRELSAQKTKLCPYAFSAVHAADFAERLRVDILPALAAGETVLCDRYFYTEIVRDRGLGLPAAWSESLFPFAPEPDLILQLDLSLATSVARIRKRIKKSRFGRMPRDLQLAVLGSLLGSLDSTTGLLVDARYKPDGNPMTDTDREQIKFGFQVATRAAYNELFARKKNVTKIDAELSKNKVASAALAAITAVLRADEVPQTAA